MASSLHRSTLLAALVVAPLAVPARAADPPALVVRTVAGGGAGDGASALDASLVAPVRVLPTADGLLVSDREAHRVRRVDRHGVITAYAGHGMPAYGGDGGRATSAALDDVSGLAADAQRRVYLADTENDRVRRVDASGVVTTFAGGGEDAEDLGDGGQAARAVLDSPTDVAVGPDSSVYIADTGNNRIRKVSPAGVITTLVAPQADGGFQPTALAVAPNGTVYVADTDAHRVWRVSGSTLVEFAGTGGPGVDGDGGPATEAMLNSPSGLAVDGHGRVLVADSGNNRVRRVAAGTMTTIAGPEGLAQPEGVAVGGDGTVYVADTGNGVVRALGGSGALTVVAGNGSTFAGDGGRAAAASFGTPAGLATGPDGALYVADATHHRVRVVKDGVVTTLAGTGATTCAGEPRVCTGQFAGDNGPATAAALNAPGAVAVSATGLVYVADTRNNVVRKIGTDGKIVPFAGNRANTADGSCPDAVANEPRADGGSATAACLAQPSGLAVDSAGSVYVADTGNNRVVKVTAAGVLTTVVGGAHASAGPAVPLAAALPARLVRLVAPRAVALAGSTLYVADTGNHRVLKVDSSGNASSFAGTGVLGNTGDGAAATSATLALPSALAVDTAGAVYVSDTGNDRVRKVSGTTISAFAGGGTPEPTSYFGDGGAPAAAVFATPLGLAVAGDRVYVADSAHGRVRGVVPAPPPSRLVLTLSAAVINAGAPVTVRGTVTNAATGTAMAGVSVRLLERAAGASGSTLVTTATSAADGTLAVTLRPVRRTTYTAEVDDTDTVGGSSASAVVAVRYVPVVTSPKASSVTARAGTVHTVTGSVTPRGAGVRVELVKVVSGKASVVGTATTRADGGYTVKATLPRGRYSLRVRVPKTATNDSGESRTWTLTVA